MSEKRVDYLKKARLALDRAENNRDNHDREWASIEAQLSIANSLIYLAQVLNEIRLVLPVDY